MSNSKEFHLGPLRSTVESLLISEGRITDKTICEYCLSVIPDNKWEIHHTKYEGATYHDLLVVCRSCNRIGENVGLK